MSTRDLVLADALTPGCYITAMNVYNQLLFVACTNLILIFRNKVVTSTLTNMCTTPSTDLNSIFFLNSELMLVSCSKDNYVKMVYQNGTLTNKIINVTKPLCVDSDPNGKLTIAKYGGIFLYP